MISREPTLERLAIAQQLLIDPFGLDEAKLAAALGVIGEHRIDDADLYFQITRHEGWSLEEGIVKSGSFGIDQGVGVRAVAGEKTAFAYSDDISEASLLDAARTVRSIAAAGQSKRVKVGRAPRIANAWLAFGHGHVGMCGGASTGRELAHLVAGRAPQGWRYRSSSCWRTSGGRWRRFSASGRAAAPSGARCGMARLRCATTP